MTLAKAFGLGAFTVAACIIPLLALVTESDTFLVAIADAPSECGDGSPVVAKALGNGRVRLNAEPEASVDQAVSRIHEVMKYPVRSLDPALRSARAC